MKLHSVFVLCVLIVSCYLLSDVDGRKSRGGSRGGGKSSRGSGGRRAPQPSAGPDFSVSAPKKAPAPDGWSIKKETKKEVPTNLKSNPVASNPAPSYPASNGLSGAGAGGVAGAAGGAVAGGAVAHSYPSSNGLSGAGGQPSYPAGTGLSGSSPVKAAPPAYSQNAPPAYSQNAPPPYGQNAPMNGYNQPMGGYHGPPPAYGAGQAYGVPGYVNNPLGGPPMSYGNTFPGGRGYSGMGGFGGGMTGFNGGYGKSNGFFSSNKLGLILTGLTVWNLMRSGRKENHHHYYNNGPDGKDREPDPETEAILRELSNCTLSMISPNDTEIIAIPCEIATSFAPNAKLDGKTELPPFTPDADSPLNCTITVNTKSGLEIKTNIPCDQLTSMAPKETPPPPELGTGGNGEGQPISPLQPFPPGQTMPAGQPEYMGQPAPFMYDNNPNCNGGVSSLTGAPCVNNYGQPNIPPGLLPVEQPILVDPIPEAVNNPTSSSPSTPIPSSSTSEPSSSSSKLETISEGPLE